MKFILQIVILLIISIQVKSQTVDLFYENFQNGTSNWNLDATDMGSQGTNGANRWIVNNIYAGGTWMLGGFVPVPVPATANQPAQIANNPQSLYMHIVCMDAFNANLKNCNYIDAASSGFVTGNAGKNFSKMVTGVNTSGHTGVSLSFWWLCNGAQGSVYYSINGGTTWTQLQVVAPTYSTAWTLKTITNAAFDNQTDLRFGFMFDNTVQGGTDPGFAVDDIHVYYPVTTTLPEADFSASKTNICQGECISFTNLSTNGPNTYQWTFQGASPATSTDDSPALICYNQPGIFEVTLIATNADGSDTETKTSYINVYAPPTVVLQDVSLCSPDTIILDANPGAVGYTFLWSTGEDTQTITVDTEGTYSVTVTDVYGCSVSDDMIFSFGGLILDVASTDPSCGIDIGAITITPSGGISPYSFTWSTTPSVNSGTISNLPAGTYSVTVSDNNGCTGSADVVLTQNSTPLNFQTSSTNAECSQSNGTATVDVTGGTPPYSFIWSTTPQQMTDTITGLSGGTYTVTITDDSGCTVSASVDVVQDTGPIAAFSFSPTTAIAGQDAIQFSNLSSGYTSSDWSFGDGNNSVLSSPMYTYQNAGTYSVWLYVYNDNGCADSTFTTITITAFTTFYVPDAFSPNGDGINDYFAPYGINMEQDDYSMRIFDRWGRMIYKTTNINNVWDGKAYNGDAETPKPDVYVYIIRYKDNTGNMQKAIGRITLTH